MNETAGGGTLADLAAASISTLAQGFASGAFDPVDLVDAQFARIDRDEDWVSAFAFLDRTEVRAQAAARRKAWRSEERRGPLDGVTIAIKDNIDVAGAPT
ncbi:MAG: amidase family protein, partial [Pseudomonadota bacterium]